MESVELCPVLGRSDRKWTVVIGRGIILSTGSGKADPSLHFATVRNDNGGNATFGSLRSRTAEAAVPYVSNFAVQFRCFESLLFQISGAYENANAGQVACADNH